MSREDLLLAPESLEALLGGLASLGPALGPQAQGSLTALRAHLECAIAARRDGDTARAVAEIGAAMGGLAALAQASGGLEPDEAHLMAALAQRFQGALTRGDTATAAESVDLMRQRSGAVPRGKS